MTKKATATISLDKAIAVEDIQSLRSSIMTPSSQLSGRSTRYEDDDLFGVERSFRLIFPDEEILFFADKVDILARRRSFGIAAMLFSINPTFIFKENVSSLKRLYIGFCSD